MTNGGVQFFIDFDGTVSKNDVVDLILERYASQDWKKIEALWVGGKIGSRECLSRQIEFISATREEIQQLISDVEIDPYFVPFLQCAKTHGLAVTIVSDGFRMVIEGVLQKALKNTPEFLNCLRIFSNRLEWNGGHWKAFFPDETACEHGCANCKSAVIARHHRKGERIVFVGDGLSDRYAAEVSELIFAKGKLLDYCTDKKLSHRPYTDFRQIQEWVVQYFSEQQMTSGLVKPSLVENN